MDSPRVIPEAQTLTPSSSGRRRGISFDSSSPEFEFWMVRNPSFPEPNLLSADELFVDGFLLPLHLLSHQQRDPPSESEPHLPDPEPAPPPHPEPESEPGPGPKISSAESAVPLSASKRWRDIFKKGDNKKNTKSEAEDNNNNSNKDKDKDSKEKKKERKSGTGTSSAAELNINIWPFSRSRSAGNACTRPKTMFGAPGSRKVNSAPCSRSNSAGESKSRKWPTSPSRAGVHLGRSSPVWQVRRGGGASGGALGRTVEPLVRSVEKGANKEALETRRSKPAASAAASGAGAGGATKAKVLNINVPMCIGYRNHLSCRSDENSALSVSTSDGTVTGSEGGGSSGRNSSSGQGGGGGRGGGAGSVGNGGNLFNLRSLFTKKVY